ncbi:ATP-binding cassette domain-containing protein [bacterium]|nr:ATP-binding cassette domain-containing protein [bacterium]NIN93217.1 ATP-binding cassette domain-containing protein [bacterium]NIO19014.1 ATP-binding cassette domain-containing protein [bacterium]NIO74143.1 ATP-binding cassette domain-containing protein [bacterium]
MIKINDVHKNFAGNRVLRGVNLEIKEGETITIIGGSGCGKSVLLKHIVGLLKPEVGEIEIDGQEITRLGMEELAEVQKKFGMLFQGAALFDSLTVGGNISFGLRMLTDFDEREVKRRVSEKLLLVGLQGIEQLMPAELSGGMKKRVALARAIAMNPKYILYDEPSTGLDPIMADVINDLILDLQEKLKITSIIVTHDMVTAYKVSDRIAMLYEGRIEEIGTPQEIRETKNPVVRQFITGSSEGPIKMKLKE